MNFYSRLGSSIPYELEMDYNSINSSTWEVWILFDEQS